jgi:protein ImuA
LDWELHVHLLKRKGPTHEGDIVLKSVPGGLESIITPRLRTPSEFIAARQVREVPHVVGSSATRQAPVRRVAAH